MYTYILSQLVQQRQLKLVLFTVIYVNFSQATYSAEEADGMMIITVEADGFSIQPYIVEINPIEILPVGGPGKVTIFM